MAAPPFPDRSDLYREFTEQTGQLKYTQEFNGSLEAVMHDKLATVGQRVLAWIKRRSWGKYRIFCVMSDGVTPAFQRDCCAELGLHKSQVSRAIQYYADRGYLRLQGKLIIPVPEPTLKPPPDKAQNPDSYAAYCERWKVANSSDFQELEVAEAIVKRIKKSRLTGYRKSRTPGSGDGPFLIETIRPPEPDTPPDQGAPPSSSAAAAPSSVAAAPESILVALQRHGTTTPVAAGRLLKECKAAKPDCSLQEIIEVIGELAAGFSRNVKNPIGVLLKQVPSAVAARQRPPNDLDELRRRLRSSDHQTSINAAGQILADEHAPVADRVDAAELLRAKGVP